MYFDANRLRLPTIIFCLMAPIAAFACGVCIKDTASEAEFDRWAWEGSADVFVVLVTGSELGPMLESTNSREVTYSIELEELIRGEYRPSLRVTSMKKVGPWTREYMEIGCGPELIISAGDRLLIFTNGTSEVYISRCEFSKLVQPYSSMDDNESIRSIDRLRRWAEE